MQGNYARVHVRTADSCIRLFGCLLASLQNFSFFFFSLRPSRSPTSATTFSSGQVKKRNPGNEVAIRGWNIQTKMGIKGCVPLSQSKSRYCDLKFDFLFHWRPNQSKIVIRTIYLRTWIVQIGISIWFEMFVHLPLAVWSIFFQMFVPASKKIQSIRIV